MRSAGALRRASPPCRMRKEWLRLMAPWPPPRGALNDAQPGRGARHQRATFRARLSRQCSRTICRSGALEVVLSEFILEELRLTLPRLSHRHGLDQTAINDLIDALATLTALVTPQPWRTAISVIATTCRCWELSWLPSDGAWPRPLSPVIKPCLPWKTAIPFEPRPSSGPGMAASERSQDPQHIRPTWRH